MRRIAISLLAVSAITVIFAGYLFLSEVSRSFPDISEGVYAGMITDEGRRDGIPFYVQRTKGSPALVVALGDPLIPAQRAPILDASGANRLPLIISGSSARFRLTGTRKSAGRYEGECLEPIRNQRRSWFLQRIDLASEDEAQAGELLTRSALVQELQRVESLIEEVKREYDSQRAKMEALNRYIVDDGSLKEKASSRLSVSSSTLDTARTSLEKLQGELDSTIQTVELSQRISPKGRLALLSRESLQRESRWIEITLKLLAPETTPGFEEQLDRANRIKAIQDQIDAERRRIEEIERLDRYRGSGAETPHEEEFYRGLQ